MYSIPADSFVSLGSLCMFDIFIVVVVVVVVVVIVVIVSHGIVKR